MFQCLYKSHQVAIILPLSCTEIMELGQNAKIVEQSWKCGDICPSTVTQLKYALRCWYNVYYRVAQKWHSFLVRRNFIKY